VPTPADLQPLQSWSAGVQGWFVRNETILLRRFGKSSMQKLAVIDQ
jgi:hypothetical protein